ncbi:hypothetical protein AXK59_23705 [Tsukamurella tyrosinosolvens]|nr:hypothetical protein AXK59_23705 [Tsukamurella tyrosinosolvens]
MIMTVGTMGSMQAASTPSAQAAPRGLYAKKCIIKAAVGPGVKGNGCNLYGAPYWTGGKLIHDPKIAKYMKSCGEGMVVSAGFAVVGLIYGPGGFISAVLLGCAQGIAQAKIYGS